MPLVNLTQDNFEEVIANNSFVVLDFWADWCGPCKQFAPIFEAAAEKYPHIVFAKIDTEAEQALAASFHIRSIPTVIIMREEVILYSKPGALPTSVFEELIEKANGLDMKVVHENIKKEAEKDEKMRNTPTL